MDVLKELSIKLNGRIRPKKLFDANFEHPSSRELMIKNYHGHRIVIEDHVNLASIVVKVNSELAFSVNRPDCLFFKKPLKLANSPFTIYVRDETESTLIKDRKLNIFWDYVSLALSRLNLDTQESAYFYRNIIIFSVKFERDLIAVIDEIVALIDKNQDVFEGVRKEKVAKDAIPKGLHPLLPYLEKYAKSDDAERDRLIEGMDESEKSALIKVIKPLFNEINTLLNSFKDKPLTDEAVAIGELAELVSELMLSEE